MKNEYDYLNSVRMDFDVYDVKPLSEEEIMAMKRNTDRKKVSVKKLCTLAACAAAVAVICAAVATGYAGEILRTISTGHNTFVQEEAAQPLPEELIGKLFDKNGVAYEKLSETDMDKLYDADGSKLSEEDLKNMYLEVFGDEIKESLADDEDDAGEVIFASIDEALSGASFDIKIPEYLPAGYELSKIVGYADDEGNAGADYRTLIYKNDKGTELYFFERRIDDNTKFTTGSSDIKETEVNGRKAVITKNSVDWETEDGVSVSIIAHEKFSEKELMKIAENVK